MILYTKILAVPDRIHADVRYTGMTIYFVILRL